MRALVHTLKYFGAVLGDLVLDVHLVIPFPGERVVNAEIVWVLSQYPLELVVVQQAIRVRHAEEEPSSAAVLLASRRVFEKVTANEAAVRRDASTSRDHDQVRVWVLLWHQHHFARWAGELDFVARLRIAEEVRAHALLRWVFGLHLRAPIRRAAHAERGRVAGHVIAVAR